jgi:hypothetical protein
MALIALILICMILCDALVQHGCWPIPRSTGSACRRCALSSSLACRRLASCSSCSSLWPPRQLTTVLGLATAGLTIACRTSFSRFSAGSLMGKNGIRIGDWVEINGVGGEVTEIGLIYTTLLETGNLADKGHPTGRRITFINNFAIRGQYFNFSTPASGCGTRSPFPCPRQTNTQEMVDQHREGSTRGDGENARIAEQEWKRGTRGDGLSRFSALRT